MKNFIISLVISPLLFASSSPSPDQMAVEPQYVQDFNAGLKAQKEGNYDDAVGYYQKAVDQKSDYADAWNNMGYCYRMTAKGYLTDAGKAYAKAIKYNPRHEAALEYQGEYFVMAGELMSAYRNLQKLQSMNSKEADKLKDKLDSVLEEAQAVLKKYSP